MAQGNAFNRNEVTSVYVTPNQRYVVSLIIGFEAEQVNSPAEAVAAALQLTRGEDRGTLVWAVHDRETGQTVEIEQRQIDVSSETA